jgi:hypothetical protein
LKKYFSVLLLVGCATTSQVVPYGKDSYIISADDAWGGYSSTSLQVRAAQRANAFCENQGQKMVVRNTSNTGVQAWTGTSSSLVFSCVDSNDSEYGRPMLRKEADIRIESGR